MAITIAPGFTWTSGATVTPSRLNQMVSNLVISAGADKLLGRGTGAGAIQEIACTAAGRDLLAAASTEDMRIALALEIGTDVQAYDPDLAAIAALSTAPYGRSFLTLDNSTAGRTLLDLFGSVLIDSKTAVTQAGSAGADLVFTGGPSVSLSAGTWLLVGSMTARTSDTADTIWCKFRNHTGSADFGAGSSVQQPDTATRHQLACFGTIQVSEESVIYMKGFRAGSTSLDLGTPATGSISGQILAVKLFG